MRISAVDDDLDYDSDVFEEEYHTSDDDVVVSARARRPAIQSNRITVRPSLRALQVRQRVPDSTVTETDLSTPSIQPASSPIYDYDYDDVVEIVFDDENESVNGDELDQEYVAEDGFEDDDEEEVPQYAVCTANPSRWLLLI